VPLSLQTQFERTTFRYVLLPAIFLLVAGGISATAVLLRREAAAEQKTLESFARVLQQQIINGDYQGLNFQLTGIGETLGWDEAAIANSDGRIVAAYPNQNRVHTVLKPGHFKKTASLRQVDGSEVGNLVWSSSIWWSLWPTFLVIGLLFVTFSAIFLWNYMRIRRVLSRHGDELHKLSDDLLRPRASVETTFTTWSASSEEGEKLTQAIFNFTETKERLAIAEADKERSQALADLAFRVAHDIRSPLSALGAVVHLSKQLEEQHRNLITMAIERIEGIANDLLKRSNAEASETGAIALDTLVADVVSEKRIEVKERGKFVLEPDVSIVPGTRVRADRGKLQRVLSNLINNSVEAVGEEAVNQKGTIRVTARQDQDWVCLAVEDEGRGIPEDILPMLGRRGATFGKSRGNGIGLADAKEAVERWGGQFRIESEEGAGTKVALWLRTVSEAEA